MSGETEQNISGWTVDTLHGLVVRLLEERDVRFEQRFIAQETAARDRDVFFERLAQERQQQVTIAFNASQKAIDKADVAYEKRFEGVNEFRSQLADQARDFMPRKEAELQNQSLIDRLNIMQRVLDRGGGQSAGRDQMWGYLLGAVGLIAGVVGIAFALAGR